MAPLLDDPPFVEDDDPTRVADRADPVRGDDGRPPGERIAQRMQDGRFRVRVDRREGIVEEDDRGSPGERPGQCRALLLAAGQIDAAFAEHRLVAGRERRDGLVELRDPSGPSAGIFVWCLLRRALIDLLGPVVQHLRAAAIDEIGGDGVAEEQAFLRDHADRAAELVEQDLADRDPRRSGSRLLAGSPDARDQVDEGALSTRGRAHDPQVSPQLG